MTISAIADTVAIIARQVILLLLSLLLSSIMIVVITIIIGLFSSFSSSHLEYRHVAGAAADDSPGKRCCTVM